MAHFLFFMMKWGDFSLNFISLPLAKFNKTKINFVFVFNLHSVEPLAVLEIRLRFNKTKINFVFVFNLH